MRFSVYHERWCETCAPRCKCVENTPTVLPRRPLLSKAQMMITGRYCGRRYCRQSSLLQTVCTTRGVKHCFQQGLFAGNSPCWKQYAHAGENEKDGSRRLRSQLQLQQGGQRPRRPRRPRRLIRQRVLETPNSKARMVCNMSAGVQKGRWRDV